MNSVEKNIYDVAKVAFRRITDIQYFEDYTNYNIVENNIQNDPWSDHRLYAINNKNKQVVG